MLPMDSVKCVFGNRKGWMDGWMCSPALIPEASISFPPYSSQNSGERKIQSLRTSPLTTNVHLKVISSLHEENNHLYSFKLKPPQFRILII